MIYIRKIYGINSVYHRQICFQSQSMHSTLHSPKTFSVFLTASCAMSATLREADLFLFADDCWIGWTLRRLLATESFMESSTYIGNGETQ